LVVIAIIGVLIGLLLPAVQAARESARRSQCVNNLKQVGLGLHNYESVHNCIPPAGVTNLVVNSLAHNQISWTARILPFLEQNNTYALIDWKTYWGVNPAQRQARKTKIPSFLCPSAPPERELANEADGGYFPPGDPRLDEWTTHYYGVMGAKGLGAGGLTYPLDPWYPGSAPPYFGGGHSVNGMLYRNSNLRFAEVTDGLSNTLLVGELSWDGGYYGSWLAGISNGQALCYAAKNVAYPLNSLAIDLTYDEWNDTSFGSDHPGGANFAFGDASVHFMSENVDLQAYKAAASRNMGEVANVLPQ